MTFKADRAERLDRFLARMLPEHSRTRLAKLIEAGSVQVQGKPRKPSFSLETGVEVVVEAEPAASQAHDLTPVDLHLDVPYEDDSLLVVNKPRGLATHPATSLREPSLVNALLGRPGSLSSGSHAYRPGIVHRLDKETTGLLVVAKTDRAHARLARQIGDKEAVRIYLALVHGRATRSEFAVEAPIGRDKRDRRKMAVDPSGKIALTEFKRVRELDLGTLIAARLKTGRTHQIRVHLAAIGHPVIGDAVYGPAQAERHPLQLHAAFLSFEHPETRERIELYQQPPSDFLANDDAAEPLVREWAAPQASG